MAGVVRPFLVRSTPYYGPFVPTQRISAFLIIPIYPKAWKHEHFDSLVLQRYLVSTCRLSGATARHPLSSLTLQLRILGNQRYVPRLWLVADLLLRQHSMPVTPQFRQLAPAALRQVFGPIEKQRSRQPGYAQPNPHPKDGRFCLRKLTPIFPCNRPRFLAARSNKKK